jgi:hypothetical protein
MTGLDLRISSDQVRSIEVVLEADLLIAIRTSWMTVEGARKGDWVYLSPDQAETVAKALMESAQEARRGQN